MANPSEEPIDFGPGYDTNPWDQNAVLEDLVQRQRTLLSNAEATNAELMLENANLRLTIDDQSEEIAKCKILKYEAVLDEMDQFFCTAYDEDEPITCGWRSAILRMREIRNG